MREFSLLAIFLGVIIGIIFGAANAYIGLKVGMTVSASIPAAVISMALLRGLLRRGNIRENNIVQTVGSVGESLAAGMIFVIPAFFILAINNPVDPPSYWEIVIWSTLGGLLGVLFMVPLRRMLIVREHEKLPYPEGTACAEVLESGDEGGRSARLVMWGLIVGSFFELVRGLGFVLEQAKQRLPVIRSEVSLDTSPALLGVGYILGIRVAGYLLAGATLGWFVIIPLISWYGDSVTDPIAPADVPISSLSPEDIWDNYVRYIGAGAVVLGGLISLLRSLGVVGSSLFNIFGGRGTGERTDRDIPTLLLLLLLAGVGTAMWYLSNPDLPPLPTVMTGEAGAENLPWYQQLFAGLKPPYINPLIHSIPVIACIIGFSFFFVTVSSRLVGVVGSSSNPASGMTIATILGTAVIIVAYSGDLGLDGLQQKLAILSVGAFVCIAICVAGDTSQDLKTGYLVKATPWKQQIAEIIGIFTAAFALAGVVALINSTYGFDQAANPNAPLAPQARLMSTLVDGVVDGNLPWELILIGIAAALIVEFLGIPSLPFAVGLYLPFYLSSPIAVGGLVRWLMDRRGKARNEGHDPGVLASSGLVAGHGVMGVLLVAAAAFIGWYWQDPRYAAPKYNENLQQWVQFDPAANTWVTDDPNSVLSIYLDGDGKWLKGDAPVYTPSTDPNVVEQPVGDLVSPHHLMPWMTEKFDFLEMEYGLRSLAYDQVPADQRATLTAAEKHHRFTGVYAVDWYQLLPLAPFLVMTLWLLLVAAQRGSRPLITDGDSPDGGDGDDSGGGGDSGRPPHPEPNPTPSIAPIPMEQPSIRPVPPPLSLEDEPRGSKPMFSKDDDPEPK
jgi:uncharacterized oligopeptide transporter (OPT) family protein